MSTKPMNDPTPSSDPVAQTPPSGASACGCTSAPREPARCGRRRRRGRRPTACGLGEAVGSAASAAASGAASAAASVAGDAIAAASIPVGGGVILANLEVVVTQPTAGDFKAFSAVCPHQGCTVDKVDAGTITCPCHGSTFDIASGAVTKGPATKGLEAKGVTVGADGITVT